MKFFMISVLVLLLSGCASPSNTGLDEPFLNNEPVESCESSFQKIIDPLYSANVGGQGIGSGASVNGMFRSEPLAFQFNISWDPLIPVAAFEFILILDGGNETRVVNSSESFVWDLEFTSPIRMPEWTLIIQADRQGLPAGVTTQVEMDFQILEGNCIG
jgi:hypothetical protein